MRGRRVSDTTDVKRKFSTVTAIAVPLLTLGVLAAMVLSGVSTSQSFTVQQLQARERELSNQVETLNRDLENMRSSSEIARQAADAGMVVPHVPGILSVDGNGAVREDRAFDPEATQKMTEVTAPAGGGEGAREDRATSDREATAQVGDNLTELPGGNVLGQNDPLDPLDPLAPRQAAPEAAAPAAPPAPAENLAPYAPRAAAAR